MIEAGEQFRGFLEARLDTKLTADAVFFSRTENGVTLGVFGIDRYTGRDCEVFMAGDKGWMTRQLLRVFFFYIFDRLGCSRCTGLVEASDSLAIDTAIRFGAQVEGEMRDALPSGSIMVLGMLKSECRWLNG